MTDFWQRLKQRKLVQWAVAYVAFAFALLQGIDIFAQRFNWPESIERGLLIATCVGFFLVLILAWYHGELGQQRVTAAELIVLGCVIALGALGVWQFAKPQLPYKAAVVKVDAEPVVAFPPNSIAVLPFANLSTDKNQEFFSDGISEELLNLLANIPQLQVTARTSSFAFKDRKIGIPEIARKLHVAHILEGSVQKAGNQVRITVQLVDAASDRQRWSQTWNRQLDDIFKIQDEIADDVIKAMKVKLLGAATKTRSTDPKAYALYLQAREFGRRFTPESMAKSDALYRQALEIDPRYAPAWNGLAGNFVNKVNLGMLSSQDGFAGARTAAQKVLQIDPDDSLAHARLARVAMYGDNDLAGAARHLERALTLNPTSLYLLGDAATLLQNLGRLDEALALDEAIVRRDPVNVRALFNLGNAQRDAGHIDAAITSLRTAVSLSPGRGGTHYHLGIALLSKGDAKAALAEILQERSEPHRMIVLPMAYYVLGRKADSDQALAALIAKYEKDGSYNIAFVYAFRGEADQAFEWLDKAVDYHDSGLGDVVTERLFANIHDDPRWLPFLRKLGKAPDQLAKIQFKVSLPKAWQTDAGDTSAATAGEKAGD